MLTDHGVSIWQNMAPASSTVSPAQTPTEQNIFGLVLPRTAEADLLARWLASRKRVKQKKR